VALGTAAPVSQRRRAQRAEARFHVRSQWQEERRRAISVDVDVAQG
jgi:hypothetical protein